MPPADIQVRTVDGVLFITIHRPSHANAYTQEMLSDLERYVESAHRDEQIKVIVLTGSGDKVFCAGADRNEIDTRSWRSVLNLKSAAVFRKLREGPKVSVAAINGAAVGGGFELALSCDIRIASPSAQFWLPELEFGLLPAAAAMNLLPKYVGMLRAKDLILGGVRWTAQDAFAAGLVSAISNQEDLMVCVMEWVARIQKRNSDAIRLGKQILELSASGSDTSHMDLFAQALLVKNKGS